MNSRRLARDAKENFEKGKFRAAEKQYQEILTKAPNNLYSLCNLGVVYFRTGQMEGGRADLEKSCHARAERRIRPHHARDCLLPPKQI